MPELPEVETVRQTLAPALGGRVEGVWSSGVALRQQVLDCRLARRQLIDGELSAVRRRGKYLLLDFRGSGVDSVLLVHLGMSGRLRVRAANDARVRHTHVELSLRKGRRPLILAYSDPRRFGQVRVFARSAEPAQPDLAKLGPDPLVDGIDGDALYRALRSSRRPVKERLLDQTVIAGVGNIYACEALWRAKIRPGQRADRISRARAHVLTHAIVEVLSHAIAHGGTSLKDFVAADGASGTHSPYLQVYGRAGQPCVLCGHPIHRSRIGGRGTFSCARCQRG